MEDKKILMACGHTAQAVDSEGKPVCVICYPDVPGATIAVTATPSLANRRATCIYCKKETESSLDLPFFEYRGPGSPHAIEMCKCGYLKVAHNKPESTCKCKKFKPVGPMDDRYYCGCRGWS